MFLLLTLNMYLFAGKALLYPKRQLKKENFVNSDIYQQSLSKLAWKFVQQLYLELRNKV